MPSDARIRQRNQSQLSDAAQSCYSLFQFFEPRGTRYECVACFSLAGFNVSFKAPVQRVNASLALTLLV